MKYTIKVMIGAFISGCLMLCAAMIVYSKGTNPAEHILESTGKRAYVDPFMAIVCAAAAALVGIGFFIWRHREIKL